MSKVLGFLLLLVALSCSKTIGVSDPSFRFVGRYVNYESPSTPYIGFDWSGVELHFSITGTTQ